MDVEGRQIGLGRPVDAVRSKSYSKSRTPNPEPENADVDLGFREWTRRAED
jgi:hypothetical protein